MGAHIEIAWTGHTCVIASEMTNTNTVSGLACVYARFEIVEFMNLPIERDC